MPKQKTDPFALILIISCALMCYTYIDKASYEYDKEIKNLSRNGYVNETQKENQRDNRRAESERIGSEYADGGLARPEYTVRKARITKYVKTGNRMANGEWPYEGAVAVSDRRVVLGTKLKIFGRVFTVADRTALYINSKFPVPTFDIYCDCTEEEALRWGVRYEDVIIEEL